MRQTKGPILAGLRSPRSSAGTLRAEPGAAPASAVHVAAHDFRMDGAVGGSTDDRRLLALAYLARLRVNGSSTSTMTGAFYATSKLVMMRNFWASTPAMPLPRPESSLPGRCPDSATNLRASTSPCTHSARTNGPKASLLPNEAAHSRAIHDSDQRPATPVPSTARWPEPAFPLMRAGPRYRSSKLGPRARAYCAGLRRRRTAARYSNEHLSQRITADLCGLMNAH